MTCEDIKKYLEAKHHTLDKSFVDIVQNAFLNGENLDLTPVGAQPTLFLLILFHL